MIDNVIDWAAAYNDLRWLLTLQRVAIALNLSKPLQQLLVDLYVLSPTSPLKRQ